MNIFGEDYSKSTLVFNFEKRHQQCTIQLITSFKCPIHCILDFHSSMSTAFPYPVPITYSLFNYSACVMNVVAHDKAYSFFPKATFEERCSLLRYRRFGGDTLIRDLAVQKYARRGWSAIDPSTLYRPLLGAFSLGERYVGDPACWMVPVHPTLELPRGTVEGNSWHMSAWSPNLMPHLIATTLMSAPELKFRYTLSLYELDIVKERIWPHVLSLKVLSWTRYVYDLRPQCVTAR